MTALAVELEAELEVGPEIDAHNTNVYVVLDYDGLIIRTVYGPFRTSVGELIKANVLVSARLILEFVAFVL